MRRPDNRCNLKSPFDFIECCRISVTCGIKPIAKINTRRDSQPIVIQRGLNITDTALTRINERVDMVKPKLDSTKARFLSDIDLSHDVGRHDGTGIEA